MKWLRRIALLALVILAGPALVIARGEVQLGGTWYRADRSPTGLAPAAAATPEAVIQVYAARAFNWRGILGVHTWIATKPAGGSGYTVHQVLGWRAWGGGSAVESRPGTPDRNWFGSRPQLLVDLRGPDAGRLIPEVQAAAASYPFSHDYRLWPGPNSNTFTAWVGRQVPELGLELPATAIGKDYLADGFFAAAPSGTGYQLSLYGLLGITAARAEGLELNLLGLVFGVDFGGPALKLPGIGRLGLADARPAAPGGR